MERYLVGWQYCKNLNDINTAINEKDENWEGLTDAKQIISITYDSNHGSYVVFWRCPEVTVETSHWIQLSTALLPNLPQFAPDGLRLICAADNNDPEQNIWACANCEHVAIGYVAPKICPGCNAQMIEPIVLTN